MIKFNVNWFHFSNDLFHFFFLNINILLRVLKVKWKDVRNFLNISTIFFYTKYHWINEFIHKLISIEIFNFFFFFFECL